MPMSGTRDLDCLDRRPEDNAYALVTLQVALAILNFRGVYKNEPTQSKA